MLDVVASTAAAELISIVAHASDMEEGPQLQVPLPESLYCSAVESKPGPGRAGL